MAGLSVAFDASCEEMWLAWRYGACLVPAPRSLVRSGMDLGPWLVANDITVVSTVPTLVALWPADGARRRPPADPRRRGLPARARRPGSSTTTARSGTPTARPRRRSSRAAPGSPASRRCASGCRSTAGTSPSSTTRGSRSATGGTGELIIGGVGLARYLDPAKDAEKYAPMPTLGWERAYRSGDLVRYEPRGPGVPRPRRRPGQGRRPAHRARRDRQRAAGAARRRRGGGGGTAHRVGQHDPRRLRRDDRRRSTPAAATRPAPRATLPAALVPRLAQVDTLPTRTSGKIDRDALPWPLADRRRGEADRRARRHGRAGCRALGRDPRGRRSPAPTTTSSTSAAAASRRPSWCRGCARRYPEVTVADVYDHPTDRRASPRRWTRWRRPRRTRTAGASGAPRTPGRPGAAHRAAAHAHRAAVADLGRGGQQPGGRRWLGVGWLPTVSWWWVGARLAAARAAARPDAAHRRRRAAAPARARHRASTRAAAAVHLRVWLAERLADELGAANLAGAPLDAAVRARARRDASGVHVDLHSVPPVTGHARRSATAASIEPEVDLSGHWLDGDVLRVGAHRGRRRRPRRRAQHAVPRARSSARAPRSRPARRSSATVPAGEQWAGAPAQRRARPPGARGTSAPRNRPVWVARVRRRSRCSSRCCRCSRSSPRSRSAAPARRPTLDSGRVPRRALVPAAGWRPSSALLVLALLVWLLVRLLGLGLRQRRPPGARPLAPGRRGRRCGCWTRRAPGCSRSTPAR